MCASQQLTTKSLLIQLSHETLFLYFLQFHRILLYSKATIFPNICIYVFGLEYKISLSNCFKQMCPSVFVAVLFHYCVHIPPAFPYCPFVFGGKCRCFFLFVFFCLLMSLSMPLLSFLCMYILCLSLNILIHLFIRMIQYYPGIFVCH